MKANEIISSEYPEIYGLSSVEIKAVLLLANEYQEDFICEQIGITAGELSQWQLDPNFQRLLGESVSNNICLELASYGRRIKESFNAIDSILKKPKLTLDDKICSEIALGYIDRLHKGIDLLTSLYYATRLERENYELEREGE